MVYFQSRTRRFHDYVLFLCVSMEASRAKKQMTFLSGGGQVGYIQYKTTDQYDEGTLSSGFCATCLLDNIVHKQNINF